MGRRIYGTVVLDQRFKAQETTEEQIMRKRKALRNCVRLANPSEPVPSDEELKQMYIDHLIEKHCKHWTSED